MVWVSKSVIGLETGSSTASRVVVNGVKSEWLPVTSGVPLGSVLAQTLFVIYINDMDLNVSSSVHKVADFTKLYSYVCTCDQTDHLQHDLDEMSE